MNERGSSLLSVLALMFAALLVAPVASLAASGLPATVTMVPEAAGPGASVEITGLDFPPNQTVELQLTTTAGPVHLGNATTVDGGYFRQTVTLPADAPPGYWELRATGPDGSAAVHLFEAAGGVAIVDAVDTAAATQASDGGNSIGDIIVMLVFALLIAGIGGAIYYVWYQSKMGDSQPGMSTGADPIWSGSPGDDPAATATDDPAWKATPASSPDSQQAPSAPSR